MKYLRINNLLNKFGQSDYKGLDINQFVPGSQAYASDNLCCVLATNEDVKTIPADVIELQQSDYDIQKSQLQVGINTPSSGTLQDYKNVKIRELENNCTKVKDGGFKSNCLGSEKTFDSSPENRNLIIGLAMKASLIASGATLADINIDWKAKDEPVCYTWTPQQMIILGVDMSTFLTNNIKHKEQLQAYVKTLTTIEEVQKVTWDTVIPTTTT